MKFDRDVCEVCGEAVFDVEKLPEDIRDLVYKPSPEELGIEHANLNRG